MVHLVFVYELLALLFVIISFNIPLIIYLKTRDKFLFHYIIFFMPFIIDCVLSILLNYMESNIDLKANIGSFYLDFFVAAKFLKEYVFIIIIFSIVYFCHYLYSVKYKNIRNIILAVISAALIFLVHFTMSVKINEDILLVRYNFLGNISIGVFILLFLYCLMLGLMNYKKMKDSNVKQIVRGMIVLSALFLPGIIYDLMRNVVINDFIYTAGKSGESHENFYIYPLSYTIMSILSSYYIVKYYFREYNNIIDDSIVKSIMKEFDLSAREIEVLKSVLCGKSNNEIAENFSISVNTVKIHTGRIYEKLGLKSRYELITFVKNHSKVLLT